MGTAKLKYLFDSVILIDHFNGIEAATRFIAGHGSRCAISVITRAEVLAGFDEASEPLARTLLDAFATLAVTAEVADRAAELRRTERWKLPDALQAAIASLYGLALGDAQHARLPPGRTPDVLVPYRL